MENQTSLFPKTRCQMCFYSISTIAVMPCRHLISCRNCSSLIKTCPICQKKVIYWFDPWSIYPQSETQRVFIVGQCSNDIDDQHIGKNTSVCECIICYDAKANTIFDPCGHMCACIDCAARLKSCCYCKKKIRSIAVIWINCGRPQNPPILPKTKSEHTRNKSCLS